MNTHHLKIRRKPFEDLVSGRKTGEVRSCADREFREGDHVELFLIDETGNSEHKSIIRIITHIQRGYGLPHDICVLSYAAPVVEHTSQPKFYCLNDQWGDDCKWQNLEECDEAEAEYVPYSCFTAAIARLTAENETLRLNLDLQHVMGENSGAEIDQLKSEIERLKYVVEAQNRAKPA